MCVGGAAFIDGMFMSCASVCVCDCVGVWV